MFNANTTLIGKNLQKANKKGDTSNTTFDASIFSSAPCAPVVSGASGIFSLSFTVNMFQTYGQSKPLKMPQSIFVFCK